jgi:hypothetical protein
MNKMFSSLLIGGLILMGALIPGCSVYMEATRPAPVRLARFPLGESRDTVIAQLGQPVTTTVDGDGASCDLYSLHLSGYGDAAKASIAFGEVAADVLTLGIAEAVSTPTEALTRNKKTPVWFCYKKNALLRITPKKLEGEEVASSTGLSAVPTAPGSAVNSSVSAAATAPAPPSAAQAATSVPNTPHTAPVTPTQ